LSPLTARIRPSSATLPWAWCRKSSPRPISSGSGAIRAIGHVRYSTTGSSNVGNAQPLIANTARGQVAIGHNGNLVNAAELREDLESRGSIFQTTVDSEIILHLLAQPYGDSGMMGALRKILGAYSLVILSERELIGVRDPFGFRPLSLGKLDGAYVLSSETCAFDLVHAEFIRDLEPGEVVIINENGIRSEFPFRIPAALSASSSTSTSRGRIR
jgi:amidophosphoribosyltransferase